MTWDSLIYSAADTLTDAINPVFLVLLLQEPLLLPALPPGDRAARSARGRDIAVFWARSLLAVGVAVVMAEMGKKYQVWHGHPNFPSGHTTFATSAATVLLARRGRTWAIIALPLVALMAWGLVDMHYHTADEVAAGLVLGVVVPLALLRVTRGR